MSDAIIATLESIQEALRDVDIGTVQSLHGNISLVPESGDITNMGIVVGTFNLSDQTTRIGCP